MVRVQRFRDTKDPWFELVPDCIAWIEEWKRQNDERIRQWWRERPSLYAFSVGCGGPKLEGVPLPADIV